MTWVFNHTGESPPLAMPLNCGVNNYFSLAWSDMFPSLPDGYAAHAFLLSSTAAAAVLLIATSGRLGCPPGARRLPAAGPDGLTLVVRSTAAPEMARDHGGHVPSAVPPAGVQPTTPCAQAQDAISTRLRVASLSWIRLRWLLRVLRERVSCSAISLFVRPRATRVTTLSSCGVRRRAAVAPSRS